MQKDKNKATSGEEITQELLEDATGGGSPLALCWFKHNGIVWTEKPVLRNGDYWGLCTKRGTANCTFALCRCHGTSNCVDGWHKCKEDGSYLD